MFGGRAGTIPGIPALHPSGHLHNTKMFKFVPGEFVEPSGFIHQTCSFKHKKAPHLLGGFFMFGGRGGI